MEPIKAQFGACVAEGERDEQVILSLIDNCMYAANRDPIVKETVEGVEIGSKIHSDWNLQVNVWDSKDKTYVVAFTSDADNIDEFVSAWPKVDAEEEN